MIKMYKKIVNFNIDNIALFLISILPIGLLIGTAVSELLSILLVVLFITKSLSEKNLQWYKNFYFLILTILWIVLILNLLFSKYPENTIIRSLGFVKYIIFVFSIAHYLKIKNNLNIIFSIWTVILLIVGFDIYFEYIFKHNILGFVSRDPDRIVSFLREELKIGHFFLGFCFICSGFFFEKYNHKSKAYIAIGFLITIFFISSIILTGERSNTLRAIFGLILYLLLFSKKINFNKKKIFLFFTIIIIVLFSISEKIQRRFNVFVIDPIKQKGFIETYKGSQQAAHYYTAAEIFKSNLLFGIGNKNFRIECENEKYYNPSYTRTTERCATHPHQIYFEFLSEHGIIGTFVILTIIFYSIYKSLITYKRNNNLIHLGSIVFIIITFLPVLPSGSFFTSFAATIFWINFSIMIFFNLKNAKDG
jgi:O-antigen ligase